jgi:mono/diheme cytochrome c family protein
MGSAHELVHPGGFEMIRRVGIALLVAGLPLGAWAQPAGTGSSLDDTQMLGQRLFYQSCVVCHTKPQITSGQYGPALSKDSLGGQEEVMRAFIATGTSRMPGFKFQFEPSQINAIVAYLKTVPAPNPPAPAAR